MKIAIHTLAAVALAGMSVCATASNTAYDSATVLDVEPIVRTVRVTTPVRECWEEEVAHRSHHGSSALGPVVGGILGGALGNAVGHHKRNKQVGAVVGAVLGATIGHAASQSHRRDGGVVYRTEERCEVRKEYHEEERIIGYHVRYRYNGQTYSTRTDTHPGDTLKVRVSVSPVI